LSWKTAQLVFTAKNKVEPETTGAKPGLPSNMTRMAGDSL
jgi:hypothetical protein